MTDLFAEFLDSLEARRLTAVLTAMVLEDIADAIVEAAFEGDPEQWEGGKVYPTQVRYWTRWTRDEQGNVTASPVYYTLVDEIGLPVACHVCNQTDRWTYHPGWDSKHNYFACLHSWHRSDLVPLRQVDTVSLHPECPQYRDTDKYEFQLAEVEVAHLPTDPDYPGVIDLDTNRLEYR